MATRADSESDQDGIPVGSLVPWPFTDDMPITSCAWSGGGPYTLGWWSPPYNWKDAQITKFDGLIVLFDHDRNQARIVAKTYWPRRGAISKTGDMAIASWETTAHGVVVHALSVEGRERIEPIRLKTRVAEVTLSDSGRYLAIRTMRGSRRAPDSATLYLYDLEAGRLVATIPEPLLLEINDFCHPCSNRGTSIPDDGKTIHIRGIRGGELIYDRAGTVVADTRFGEGIGAYEMWKNYVEHYANRSNLPVEVLEYLDDRLSEWHGGSGWTKGTDHEKVRLMFEWNLIKDTIRRKRLTA